LLVLGVARDQMKSGEIEATARAYSSQPEIIAEVAHNSMVGLRWQAVEERILAWLTEKVWGCGSCAMGGRKAHGEDLTRLLGRPGPDSTARQRTTAQGRPTPQRKPLSRSVAPLDRP
jgi:hypothetical protein